MCGVYVCMNGTVWGMCVICIVCVYVCVSAWDYMCYVCGVHMGCMCVLVYVVWYVCMCMSACVHAWVCVCSMHVHVHMLMYTVERGDTEGKFWHLHMKL